MSKPQRFEIDRARIIFEQFEDETVLINTESGYYYSLSNEGSEILHLLDDGHSVDELAAILFEPSSDFSRLRTMVESFAEQLVKESILIARTAKPSAGISGEATRNLQRRGPEYPPPLLERFDDVRELLLIDPVHQVDRNYGWPKSANPRQNSGQ